MLYYNSFAKYLQQIEQVFLEKDYLEAEELYAAEKISLKSMQKKLWIMEFADKETHEVEIMLKSDKLNSHTCDCHTFKAHRICPHIIASYLWIRDQVEHTLAVRKEEEKRKEARRRRRLMSKQGTTVSSILDQANKDDIRAFLLAYARKDKKLSTAIKVHFLSKAGGTSRENISAILDSIAPPVTTADKKMHNSSWLLLNRSMEEFSNQTGDFISLLSHREAANIIVESLFKLYYLVSKYPDKIDKILHFVHRFTELTEDLFNGIEAPMEKDQIKAMFLEISERSYFNTANNIDFIHVLLSQKLLDKDEIARLLEICDSLESEENKQIVHAKSLGLRLRAASNTLTEDALQSIPKKYMNSIILEIIDEEDFDCLELVIRILEESEPLKYYGNYKLLLLQSKNKIKQYKALALELYKVTEEYNYYRKYASVSTDEELKKVPKKLLILLESMSDRAKLEFWKFQNNTNEIIDVLDTTDDIELHFEYAKIPGEEYNNKLFPIYVRHIDNYLENFIGSGKENFLRQMSQHLELNKSRKFKRELINHIKSRFGHRDAILNTLN